jgi:hypothetical protein
MACGQASGQRAAKFIECLFVTAGECPNDNCRTRQLRSQLTDQGLQPASDPIAVYGIAYGTTNNQAERRRIRVVRLHVLNHQTTVPTGPNTGTSIGKRLARPKRPQRCRITRRHG